MLLIYVRFAENQLNSVWYLYVCACVCGCLCVRVCIYVYTHTYKLLIYVSFAGKTIEQHPVHARVCMCMWISVYLCVDMCDYI
jgi:hypothetical protein